MSGAIAQTTAILDTRLGTQPLHTCLLWDGIHILPKLGTPCCAEHQQNTEIDRSREHDLERTVQGVHFLLNIIHYASYHKERIDMEDIIKIQQEIVTAQYVLVFRIGLLLV